MLELFHSKAVLRAITAMFCCCFFSLSVLNAQDASRTRALGDAALKAHDYKRAAKYYRQYKAASAGDQKHQHAAYIRLLSAYISASNIPAAKRELAAFSEAFPHNGNNHKVYYQSSILILEREYKEAEKLLLAALKSKINKKDLYFELLSTLGLCLRRQKLWQDAVKVYALLEKEAKGTPTEFTAFQQKLYCLIMGEDLIKSKKLFAESKKFKLNSDYSQLNLLFLLQMTKEKKFSELRLTYAKAMKGIEISPNPLVYKIAQIAIKHFLKNDKPEDAIIFLRNAFKFAPNKHERKNSLLLLINTYAKIKQNNNAIGAALKYIRIYYDDPKTIEVQIQCARLMASEKMFTNALAVYTTLLKEPRLTPEQRISVAREAAIIYELNGAHGKAIRMLSIIYKVAPNSAGRMEGKYLQGQLYYKNEDFAEAAAAFEEVMVQKSPWRNSAVYWALQSQLHLKNYAKALHIAKELRANKKSEQFASTGQYYFAYCQEQLGKPGEALKNYQIFAKLYPKAELAPMALFAAGKILFTQKKFAEVVQTYKDFSLKFPKNEFAPNVLYKSIFACYQIQKWDEMEKAVRLLAKNYPESNYCVAAEFWLIDSLRNRGKYEEAEAWIRKMLEKYSSKPEITAQLLYDYALVCSHSRKSQQALKELEKLFKEHPKNDINAKALFLAGDIASKEGNYALAVIYYRRAAKLRPQSDFEIACLGRIADCDYSLYNTTFDPKLLKKAAQGYESLLKMKKMSPSIRNQSKYKLGRCYELLNEENNALDMYNELLYDYQIDQAEGLRRKPVWVVKAARAAVLVYLKMDTPEAAREAIRVYHLLKDMKLKTGENLDGFIKNIQSKYNLGETL